MSSILTQSKDEPHPGRHQPQQRDGDVYLGSQFRTVSCTWSAVVRAGGADLPESSSQFLRPIMGLQTPLGILSERGTFFVREGLQGSEAVSHRRTDGLAGCKNATFDVSEMAAPFVQKITDELT